MSEVNQNFNRREQKYVLSKSQTDEIQDVLSSSLPSVLPETYTVTTVYLDTKTLSVISRSLDKPLYKEKLRIRAYGSEQGEALICAFSQGVEEIEKRYGNEVLFEPVFFELKKKFKGIVYKRRIEISLGASVAFFKGASLKSSINTWPVKENNSADSNYLNFQIAHEISACMKRLGELIPSMATRCTRRIFGDEDFRVTFDSNLQYLNLTAENNLGNCWRPIINPECSIMEIKTAESINLSFVNKLTESNIFPSSFSKYGTAATLEANAQAAPIGLTCNYESSDKQLDIMSKTTTKQEAKRA